MDELLQHCLQDLAFDGDYGCSIARLRDFVQEFYLIRSSMHQTLDDAYHAFVWSLIAQHPSVRVGLLPEGQTTDIYVPPQPRVSRKGKGAQDDIRDSGPTVTTLDPIPDYTRYSLEELTQLYGDKLRIAVDSETCFATVTGSHAKPAKLTPMVYAALQIIARSRDSGISVLELGKATGYDQKTCFYIVKQLLELGLIVKLRRGGNSQNFCVHKYFFNRSPVWKSVRDEEYRAKEESSENTVVEDAAGGSGIVSYQVPHFEPMDTRHLTSLSILRQRLIKLLKCSPGGVQPYANISVKIGFFPRSRTDRRFFIARLNELIKEGVIEKFFMTSMNPDTTHNKQLFLRLASSGRSQQIPADLNLEIADDDEMIDTLVTEDRSEQVQLKTTLTLHKQIIDLLQEFSSSGATLNELSERLGSFDKKTLELLISRMERQPPPPHLADSSVIQVLETHGRERRYRFFSLGGYYKLMEREGVERPPGSYSIDELHNAGGFMEDRKDEFYIGLNELQAFYKKCGGTRVPRFKDSTKVAVGRSPRDRVSTGRQDDSASPRTMSEKKTNPILPDGTRKRGRPPKTHDNGEGPALKRVKQLSGVKTIDTSCPVEDQEKDIEAISPAPEKRKRGRPPKKKPANVVLPEPVDATANAVAVQVPDYTFVPTKESSNAPLPEGSTESFSHQQGNAGLSEDVTRVIASLAAQLNAPFTPNAPSSSAGQLRTANPEAAALVSSAGQGHGKVSEKGDHSASETSTPLVNQDSMDVLSVSLESISNSATTTDGRKPFEENQLSSVTPLRRPQHSGFQQGKPNLSAIRRENEFLQLIENSGGIINTSTTGFIDTYMNFIETSVKAGEATSAPIGARTDRRTLNYTLDKLEEAGRIKSIITSLPSTTGGYRKARVAYLSTVAEESVRDWLSRQRMPEHVPAQEDGASDSASGTGLDLNRPHRLAKQWLHSKKAHEIHQERWHKNIRRAGQLFGQADEVVREALLMEKQTLSQQYGYYTGKIMRAKELHHWAIKQFEGKADSSLVLSQEQRIIHWSFFENDIPLAAHCACFTAAYFVPEVRRALETEDGRNRRVKGVPDEWKEALQIGTARSRDRIFDLLDYLHSLRLVTPLRRTGHHGSRFTQGEGDSSTSNGFEPMPSDWATRVPSIRPEYWQLSVTAPLYLFALRIDPAPLWKTVPVGSLLEVEHYWRELKNSCLDKSFAEKVLPETISVDASYNAEQRVATALRRKSSWVVDYTLSWYQTQYLKRFVDIESGNTPLQETESGETLQRISDVVHAPLEVVRKYFASSGELIVHQRAKRQQRQDQEGREKREADMKLLLLHKKLEAVKSREAAWQAIVDKVHPGLIKGVAASRLRKLRQSYVQGTVLQDNHHWELQVSDAIRAAEKMRSSRRLFPNVPKVASRAISTNRTERDLSRLPISAQGKSVETLLKLQENLLSDQREPEDIDKRKGKRGSSARKGGRIRRKRFQWNTDYDELARDAYAILSARCRGHHRLEWSAVDQIFPSLPRGSVRARMSILKDQPGAEAYLQRLENCWYELWVKKRGTPELPDPHPRDPTDFDLKAHLQCLRKYVDKNAIRVGVSMLNEPEFTPLPTHPEELVFSWNIEVRKAAYMNWDFLSQVSVGEETREKMLLEAALIVEADGLIDEEPLSDTELLTEAVLKMVIGTPDISYNADEAAALLRKSGDRKINAAMDRLLARNVLSKLVKDPTKAAPGRTLKISEINQNALGGPLAKDLFVDASQLDESYEMAKDEWREWALTSSDGDTAALLQRFSEHLVEFEVDTSHAQSARAAIDGNSRKVDDDDIELRLQVKLNDPSAPKNHVTPVEDEPDAMELDGAPGSGHGTSVSGEKACCDICTGGVVNCLKCIDEARRRLDEWPAGDRNTAEFIIQQVENKGKSGIGIEELRILASVAEEAFNNVIHSLHTLQVPLIYLIGYHSSTAVSAKYVDAYAVTVPVGDGSALKTFPRRWLDMTGGRIQTVWEAGLRAVIGMVHLRPGISQAELRWRLRAVYDRQEILDLLNHLMSNGVLEVFRNSEWQRERCICIHALSKEEEKAVYWKVREEIRWYRIP